MNKLHELGTGWTIKEGVATRGSVTVTERHNPEIYRASCGEFTASDYNSPITALASLRRVLARHMQRAESALDDMAEALAAIDAPAPPADETCKCKTAVMLASVSTVDCDFELWRCEWDCERAFISYQCNGIPLTKRLSLSDAGCPADYWPENCHNRPDAVIQWFLEWDGVTE